MYLLNHTQMRVVLYGKGWLAGIFKSMCPSTWEVVDGGRIEEYGSTKEELERLKPDRVVCMIGRTHGPGYKTIDYLEQKGKLVENVRDNLYAPVVLAQACTVLGVHLTYLGTGCIFTYDDGKKLFYEDDEPNFFGSSYSTVKGFTDRLMHELYPHVLNVRIRMPIHSVPNGRNFIDKLVSYKKICSIPNSMTVLDDLLPLIIEEVEKKSTGTLNATNPGAIEHNEILEMYKEIVDPTHTYSNFTYEEQMQILASGRSNCELDASRLEGRVPHIRDSVRRCLYKFKDRQ